MLVLVLGDFMVPNAESEVPLKLRSLLVPGKIHQILCTGNLTTMDALDWLKTVAPEVYTVRGDMDNLDLPGSRVHSIGPLKLALVHGHQLIPWDDTETLALTARHMDVDILITGHSCHVDCFEFEGRMFINPGSVTGAWRPGVADVPLQSTAAISPTTTTSSTTREDSTAISSDTDPDRSKEKVNDSEPRNDLEKSPKSDNSQNQLLGRIRGPRTTPSFVLLDVQDLNVTIYVYQLFDDEEVKIVKMEYKKLVSSPTT